MKNARGTDVKRVKKFIHDIYHISRGVRHISDRVLV